jgi:hypothetical protein
LTGILSDAADALLFDYRGLDVQGSNSPRQTKSKACSIDIELEMPTGWAFGLGSVEYRGNAILATRTSTTQATSYSIKGLTNRIEIGRKVIKGTLSEDYATLEQRPISFWTTCLGTRQTVSLRTSVAVLGDGSISRLTDIGAQKHRYGIVWQQCTPPTPNPDEVVQVRVPRGYWDGDFYLCVDLKTGIATTKQIGTRYAAAVDVALQVETYDGTLHDFILSTVSETLQLPGHWRRVVEAQPEVIGWSRQVAGLEPTIGLYASGTKRCLRLVDGAGRRPGGR